MKYDKELINIMKAKKFKTFWHQLDYLLLAGYTSIDAFGVSLQQFGESKIFSEVGFIRIQTSNQIEFLNGNWNNDGNMVTYREPLLVIGLIDDTNIHLSGLYTTYRKWLLEGRFPFSTEIENTCEIISTDKLTPFIIDYLIGVGRLHFGSEIFPPFVDNSKIIKLNRLR